MDRGREDVMVLEKMPQWRKKAWRHLPMNLIAKTLPACMFTKTPGTGSSSCSRVDLFCDSASNSDSENNEDMTRGKVWADAGGPEAQRDEFPGEDAAVANSGVATASDNLDHQKFVAFPVQDDRRNGRIKLYTEQAIVVHQRLLEPRARCLNAPVDWLLMSCVYACLA